jgi:hypothetical protein
MCLKKNPTFLSTVFRVVAKYRQNQSMENQMNRRNFLKGSGVLLSLPMLESFADPAKKKAPVRLMYFGLIYGVTKDTHWFPAKTGKNYEISYGLKPLEKHKKDFTVFGNVGNPAAKDSHYSCTTLYTGADLTRTPGRAFHNSISCDQIAGKILGRDTRYNSMELTCTDGGTGPGLSLAWDAAGKPIPGMQDPVEVYNHLFGDGKMSIAERKQMLTKKNSILDAVNEECKSISKVISKNDKDKLDEYFQSIRQIEGRLSKSEEWLGRPKPKAPLSAPKPGLQGMDYMKMMYDLMIAALQTDSTRVVSFRQPIRTILKDLQIPYSAHQLSHHKNQENTFDSSRKKDQAHSELLCYIIDKLKATRDIDGKSLYDNSVVCWSSGVRHGHMLRNVPTIMTGGGGGHLKHQGHIHLKEGKNRLSNLWLTSLKAAGLPIERFADSNGIVEEMWS